jgi:hypothetical protein
MTGPGGNTYVRVKRLGGAGDGGRDIEARYTEKLVTGPCGFPRDEGGAASHA